MYKFQLIYIILHVVYKSTVHAERTHSIGNYVMIDELDTIIQS